MRQTLSEIIKLVSAKVAGHQRYLAICVQSLLTEGIRRPTFTRPVCLFRNVLTIDGRPQPWLWKDRPYFATASGELLVFVKASTQCAGCGKRIAYGLRDARNAVFCNRCPVAAPVPSSLPTDPLSFRHGRAEVALVGIPTSVWPDQFPVAVLRDFIKKELGEAEALSDLDGSDLDDLVGADAGVPGRRAPHLRESD